MNAKIWFGSLFAATVACACGGSCTGDASSAGGGALADAAPDEGGDVDAADHHDAPADDGMDAQEEPWGEAGWKPVAWDTPCPVEVAEHPEAAVAPLVWETCADAGPGCEQANLDWDHLYARPWGAPSVVSWGAGYRVGELLFFADKETRAAVYDEAGKPLVAWRADACALIVPALTPNRVWMGALSETQTRWIVEPYDKLATTSVTANVKVDYQGYAANDSVLGLWGPSGTTATIFDRLSDTVKTFGPPPGIAFYQPYPVNDSALMRQYPEFGRAEGWIWNHSTNTTIPLVQPGNAISVADFKSDGTTLIWVEGTLPIDMMGHYPSADLWTSPFATEKSGIVAKKRRALPVLGQVSSHANAGFYALYSMGDKMVHVYRLSDAMHWAFKPPPSSLDFYDVSYVDEHYVWYQTFANIYRQAISALGPGDLPP
jgi:hypothetical protein